MSGAIYILKVTLNTYSYKIIYYKNIHDIVYVLLKIMYY